MALAIAWDDPHLTVVLLADSLNLVNSIRLRLAKSSGRICEPRLQSRLAYSLRAEATPRWPAPQALSLDQNMGRGRERA